MLWHTSCQPSDLAPANIILCVVCAYLMLQSEEVHTPKHQSVAAPQSPCCSVQLQLCIASQARVVSTSRPIYCILYYAAVVMLDPPDIPRQLFVQDLICL